MFQSYNTVIINSMTDNLSGAARVQGSTGLLRVLRVNDFKTANICKVYKNPASAGTKPSATLAINGLTANTPCRLNLYIRLSGSNNSYYANDMLLKGKPFIYEFIATGTAATDAALIEKAVKKLDAFYGIKWFDIKATDSNVTITGLDTLQMITKADVEELVPGYPTSCDNCNAHVLTNDQYVTKVAGTIVKNVPEFGTYNQMIKDIKLPTLENFAWESQDADELPVAGKKYNQYIIEYVVDRGLFGGAAVGQQVTSKTEHYFYVNEDCVTAFESALTAAGITGFAAAAGAGTHDPHTEAVIGTPALGDGVQDLPGDLD